MGNFQLSKTNVEEYLTLILLLVVFNGFKFFAIVTRYAVAGDFGREAL